MYMGDEEIQKCITGQERILMGRRKYEGGKLYHRHRTYTSFFSFLSSSSLHLEDGSNGSTLRADSGRTVSNEAPNMGTRT